MPPHSVDKIISPEEGGVRLDRCLRLWIPNLPQSIIERAARKGALKVEGRKAKPSLRVETGQSVSFPSTFLGLAEEIPPQIPHPLTHAERKWLKGLILFQNEDLVVLNKPAGISVQKGTKQTKALDDMMKVYDEDAQPRLVHRLDQETSGVLVLARTLPMARWLTKAFKDRKVQKTYWALVCGVPAQKTGTINLSLSKKADAIWEKVQVDPEEGVSAVTHYRILESFKDQYAWLELNPQTGRTHQLRVHCASGLKTPILGDGKYGGKEVRHAAGLCLHARSLTIPLPDGVSLTFEAPLSEGFEEVLDGLREEKSDD